MITGSMVMFAGSSAPNGWLICDGSAVSRETYSSLFNAIGTTYGAGDGNTTFNLPDLSGKVLIGYSSAYPCSSTGGEETHTITNDELPSHAHLVPTHGHSNGITVTTPELSHSITQAVFKYNAPSGSPRIYSGYTTNSSYSGTTSTNANRSTSVAVSNHNASNCSVSGSIDDCDAFNTNMAGLGESHDNMQPFITLNYIIYAG